MLSDIQKRVLSLGLKFIPTSGHYPNCVHQIQKRQSIEALLQGSTPQGATPIQDQKPPPASVEIEQYLNRVNEGLENLTTLQVSDNLSRAEHRALQSLSNNPDLVIKNADKGSGIVVEDRESYIEDGLAHLSDENIYKKIPPPC